MKECRQCGQSVQDVETYCPRCGSGNLVQMQDINTRQPARPQPRPQQSFGNPQNQQNNQFRQPQQAPPGFRNPNAVNNRPPQPGQRPMNGQPPMQGQPGQRPMNNGQMQGFNQGNNQGGQMPGYGQRPMNGQPNQMGQRPMQPPRNQPMGIDEGFEAEAPKKGLFGKGKKEKAPKEPKAPKAEKPKKLSRKEKKAQKLAEMQQMQEMQGMNGFDDSARQEQVARQNAQARQFAPQSHNMNVNDFETDAVGNFDEVVSVKEWFFMLLKMLIPIYNIVFLIKVLTGNTNSKQSMVNFMKLQAIMIAITVGFSLLTGLLVGVLGALA